MSDYLRNLSAEDRRNLSSAFQKEAAKKEADKLGADIDSLRKKVVDGKYQWVHQAQILQEEERRKQVEQSTRPIRALRGGENSLVRLIQKMMQTHQTRIHEAERLGYFQSIEKLYLLNNTTNIITRTETYAQELAKIEEQIEQTKMQNPVFEEAEKLLLLISELKKRDETAKIQELQRQYASLLSRYQKQRKKLGPLIESARHQRAAIQREYWRVMLAHFNLQHSIFQKDCENLTAKLIVLPTGQEKTALLSEVNETKILTDGIIERKDQLTRTLPSDVQPKEEAQSWDDILPVMPPMLDEIEFMIEVLKSIDAKVPSSAPSDSSQGIAFTSKKPR